MHEDSFVLGKGNSLGINVRNFELLKWINANSFRTSHYPYDESWYDLADELGILIIDEVPAVGMWLWDVCYAEDRINDESKKVHKRLIKELIERDKNHPSVIMLSVANEPETKEDNYSYRTSRRDNHKRACETAGRIGNDGAPRP